MIYTLIISLLIEKPFYLLSPQSFSFQIVSEFIDIFVKFSNFMSRGWGFWPEGRVFVHNDCPGERFLLPSSRVSGVCPGGGMVMDEIDTCIKQPDDVSARGAEAVVLQKLLLGSFPSICKIWSTCFLAIWLLLFKQRRMQFKLIKRRLFC